MGLRDRRRRRETRKTGQATCESRRSVRVQQMSSHGVAAFPTNGHLLQKVDQSAVGGALSPMSKPTPSGHGGFPPRRVPSSGERER